MWTITTADENKSLRSFLYEQRLSRATLKEIKFHGGEILVNGITSNVRTQLRPGDSVVITFPAEIVSPRLMAEELPLSIVYEDDLLLVVNKPAGMSTIPSHEHPTATLANALLWHYQARQEQATIHTVTRLDRDTSGLVLIAKYRHIHHLLSLEQKEQRIRRQYQALVHGVMDHSGSIDLPIGRKDGSIIERQVRPDGKPARTNYEQISSYNDFSHIWLQLETGRTHQIRVHLSHLGYPLLGDTLYGGDITQIERQALHCATLTFTHPFTRKTLTLTAPLPNDIIQVLNLQT